ncbi:MAG TPA: hypothetical protein VM686_07580 [Polyangiaceae bacterium]|jgi:hypothetical protein|nr:hypothetical protein [Polyangiaceae bacterium]
MKLLVKVSAVSASRLTRIACVVGLPALLSMAYSVLDPRPLPVIWAMSVGQGLGVLAFLFYLLAVVVDTARSRPPAKPE